MSTSIAAAVLALALASSAAAQEPDAELRQGTLLVEQGEYAQAIIVLDSAARRLDKDVKARATAAQAFFQLGVAYVGSGQESLARASFRESLARNPTLDLSAFEVSPKVREVLQQARDDIDRRQAQAPAPAAVRKGGSHLPLVLVGVAAVGGGVALAAGGGSGDPDPGPAPSLSAITGPRSRLLTVPAAFTVTSQGCGTLSWSFGDGAAPVAGDSAISHTYTQEGTFEVTATARCSDGRSATARTTITVRSVGGSWDGANSNGGAFALSLAQSGNTVTGTLDGGIPVRGIIAASGLFTMQTDPGACGSRFPAAAALSLDTVNDAITQLGGVGTMPCGVPNGGITLTRR